METLNNPVEIRIATLGNVDSGKSTLVGVLSKCTQDDGRGSARSYILNFNHELINGQTSSIAQEIMSFKNGAQIEPQKLNGQKNTSWSNLVKESDKIISLIDLCGHEKFRKTTIFGLTGCVPNYVMITIGANMGLSRISKEHIGIALTLKLPIIIVITKIDIAPDSKYKETLEKVLLLMKQCGQKIPRIIKENDNFAELTDLILNESVCPIFPCSSVTGDGIANLKKFISLLKVPNSSIIKNPENKVEFLIDGVYTVQGIGFVVAGTLISGTVEKNKELFLGPDINGEFKTVIVKGIHFKRMNVDEIKCGYSCCFNIKSNKFTLKKEMFRKGMVLVDKELTKNISEQFEAEVNILPNPATMRKNYQSIIHAGIIRQPAKMIEIKGKELLRMDDSATVIFKFIKSPEYLQEGINFIFRDGQTRGYGKITKLLPFGK